MSQTQTNLIPSGSGIHNTTNNIFIGPLPNQNGLTLSSSRLLSNLQERMMADPGNPSKHNKAATAAVAAARVSANINAAAA